jgi:hypothetical protein
LLVELALVGMGVSVSLRLGGESDRLAQFLSGWRDPERQLLSAVEGFVGHDERKQFRSGSSMLPEPCLAFAPQCTCSTGESELSGLRCDAYST